MQACARLGRSTSGGRWEVVCLFQPSRGLFEAIVRQDRFRGSGTSRWAPATGGTGRTGYPVPSAPGVAFTDRDPHRVHASVSIKPRPPPGGCVDQAKAAVGWVCRYRSSQGRRRVGSCRGGARNPRKRKSREITASTLVASYPPRKTLHTLKGMGGAASWETSLAWCGLSSYRRLRSWGN